MRSRILTVFVYVFVCVSVNVVHAAPIRIMGIGNSFTMDAMGQELQPIFTSEAQEVILGYPFRGGTWLSQHDAWKNRKDTMPYNYYEYRNGVQKSTGTSSYNMIKAIKKEPWDYVIIQSDHDSAGFCKSYEPYLTNLIKFVKDSCKNKDVKIGLYMTWAYDSISTYSSFKLYKYNNQLMYDSILHAVQQVLSKHKDIDFVIPAGTAVQNARTSYLGHTMNRDGYHMNYTYGRYTAALCWYRAIMGKDPKGITYFPESISEYCAHACQAAVHEAFEKPFEVTSIKEEFGRQESDVQAKDESRMRRVTFNGMNVPLVEGVYQYNVPVDTAMGLVNMCAYSSNSKAKQIVRNQQGEQQEPQTSSLYQLKAPAIDETMVYTDSVFSEDGQHVSVYTFTLTGTAAKDIVYPIGSRADLEDFAATVNSGRYGINARMTCNINMNHTRQNCWETPIGTFEHPYTGTFDGQGYTISNFEIYAAMNIKLAALQGVGLFGAIQDATIRGINIVGGDESYFNRTTDTSVIPEVKTKGAGILCGYMTHSLIEDCSVTMDVYTDLKDIALGLICGRDGANFQKDNPQLNCINRCWAAGTWRIRVAGIFGGLLGYSNYMKITNCYNLSKLDLQRNVEANIGGLVGYGNTGDPKSVTIENSYNYGQILDSRGSKTATVYMGAIGGYMNGTHIQTNCYYVKGSWTQANGKAVSPAPEAVDTLKMTNGELAAKLGKEFIQGIEYPVLNVKGEYTCTKSLSDLAKEYGWQKGDTCITFRLGPVTFSTTNEGSATYKNGFFRNGNEWCLYYQYRNGPLRIVADSGYCIKDVKFTYVEYTPGILSDSIGAGQTAKYKSGSAIVVNDTVKQLYVGNTGGNTGYLGFTSFSVTYFSTAKLPEQVLLSDQLLTVGNVFQMAPAVYPASALTGCRWSVDNKEIVLVDAEGIVTTKASGTAYVTATFANGVADTCKVVVAADTNQTVIETFSNCQVAEMQSGTTSVMGDKGLYTWRLTNYQRQARDMVGADQGIRVRYNGDIKTDGEQQGGVKSIAFDWRVTGKNNPVNYRVKVGNKVQTYATNPIGSDAVIQHYAYDFRQPTNTSMAISVAEKQVVNQTFIIVGPVTITPYLLYKQLTDTVELLQTLYDCTSADILINNTDGEGEVSYAILADSTAQASMENGVLDLSNITRAGDIIVKASWNEGRVYTTFTLHVKENSEPTTVQHTEDSTMQPLEKVIKDGQLYIRKDGKLFSVLGTRL